ncbi:glycosyltransferase family 4 protein [Photobacterium carnosum]|uniref:glycosyltransferase family 4 protein n=1 Tax=Photobacterium carnosum TaxID=2023717 RepID=UPI001E55747C|nr:glycosyltransferase family 4 protein [Photobacterium carnosum]MCD9497749.1 glycosyltransferase [Photobacterium carnosum]
MKVNVVVAGTSSPGGIKTVIESFEKYGFYKCCNYMFLCTHMDRRGMSNFFLYFRQLIKFIFKLFSGVDIIHVHCSMRGSFYRKSILVLLSKLFKVKIIFHLHGSEFKDFYNNSNVFFKKYISFIFNQCSVVFVLSESWMDFVSGFSNANIVILNNSVDTVIEYTNTEIIDKSILNYNKLLFLGALGKRKGIFDLLDVCWKLNENGYIYTLLIGGNGDIDAVNKYICMHELNNVKFIGWVDSEKKKDLLFNSGQLLLPSYNEGLPMVILEAMSYGCNVVSTTVGGIPEVIVNGINGYLIEPGDKKDLYNIIKKNLDSFDPKICVNAINTQQSCYSTDLYFKRLDKIYISLDKRFHK